MIIAMVAVRMMKMSVDKIVDVIAVWHRWVPALRPMHMSVLVAAAAMFRCAPIWIVRAHLDRMLVHVVSVRMMEMAIMQIVDMAIVANGRVAAARAMLMAVIRMMREVAGIHRKLPSQLC
jgi:hypothetical protein